MGCNISKSLDEKKPQAFLHGVSLRAPCEAQITSLTITYFHTGCSTIIGAKSFHGPVRDGKGWDRFAMVIRHNLYERLLPIGQQGSESGRSSKDGVMNDVSTLRQHARFLSLYLLRL